MHVAESVCPYPMTKVTLAEYYSRLSDKLTIFGGIPSNLLLPESTSDAEFKAYMDELFTSVAPGYRMLFGVADSTPPGAKFERLVEIGKRVAKEAQLPIAMEKKTSDQPVRTPQSPKKDKTDTGPTEGREEYIQIRDDILAGDHIAIIDHVDKLLEEGTSASNILQMGMLPSMEVIGQRFKDGTVFIPEVLMSARAMNLATEHLEPYLGEKKAGTGGKILIGTVHGDLHDIGKNIVATMLKGVGYEVIDIGINIPTDEFLRQVEEQQPQILALSALLTTTMPEMENVIHQIESHGLHRQVKVIVGGAPVNQKFAQDIGADGYANDAGQAVEIVRRFF